MKKETRKLIKKMFYEYPKNFNKSVTLAVEWAESNMAVDYSKVAVQTTPGNYKETQLCNVIDKNIRELRWCYVIEKVLDHYKFEQDKVKFIKTFYFDKKGEILTCLEVGISRRTLFRMQDEVFDFAYKWAKELKVIGE